MAETASKRGSLIAYAVPAIFLIGYAILLVTFPEIAGRLAVAFEVIIVTVGILFVVGGLFRRDPSMLLTGAGFLIVMTGAYYSKQWMTLPGIATYAAGSFWMMRRRAAGA
jgi:hypothetical protein